MSREPDGIDSAAIIGLGAVDRDGLLRGDLAIFVCIHDDDEIRSARTTEDHIASV